MEERAKHLPVTVMMTADTLGGVWSYTVGLCKSLAPYNVQIHLVTVGAPMQGDQKQEIGELENVTAYETDFLLEWMESPWASIDASCGWMLKLADEIRPDIIHLNHFAYGALPWKAPVLTTAHSDVYSWWHAVKHTDPPIHLKEYFGRVRNSLENSTLIIAPSQAVMHDVQRIYKPTVPVKVIYNSSDAASFYPGNKQLCAISMGRIWDEAKNISLLAEAAKMIPYPIRLAGDNSFGSDTWHTSQMNITMLGRLVAADVAEELSLAAVYVMPAKYEPFGLSVLEAALSGCALVLGDIPSLREIWGDSALYADTDNAVELAAAINHLLENEEERLKYVQRSTLRAKRYTSKAMVTNYIKVYKSLLKTKSHLLPQENLLQ